MSGKNILLSIFFFCVLLDVAAQAKNPIELKLSTMVDSLIEKSFPELKNTKIDFKQRIRPGYNFMATTSFKNFFKSKNKRGYRIQYNPYILNQGCLDTALYAVLAHELTHLKHYKTTGLLRNSFKVVFKKSSRKYERQTDLETIERGYGAGLIEYKRCAYPSLTPAQLEEKKKRYLTPEEIEKIIYAPNR